MVSSSRRCPVAPVFRHRTNETPAPRAARAFGGFGCVWLLRYLGHLRSSLLFAGGSANGLSVNTTVVAPPSFALQAWPPFLKDGDGLQQILLDRAHFCQALIGTEKTAALGRQRALRNLCPMGRGRLQAVRSGPHMP